MSNEIVAVDVSEFVLTDDAPDVLPVAVMNVVLEQNSGFSKFSTRDFEVTMWRQIDGPVIVELQRKTSKHLCIIEVQERWSTNSLLVNHIQVSESWALPDRSGYKLHRCQLNLRTPGAEVITTVRQYRYTL
jgi:hypothetical protein